MDGGPDLPLSSFFRSELHMALLECVAKNAPAEAADSEPVFALLGQPRLAHALHRVFFKQAKKFAALVTAEKERLLLASSGTEIVKYLQDACLLYATSGFHVLRMPAWEATADELLNARMSEEDMEM